MNTEGKNLSAPFRLVSRCIETDSPMEDVGIIAEFP